MKVLFLDIDGVINTVGGELGLRHCLQIDPKEEGLIEPHEAFDPACLWYLREIVEDTGCKIVVSSTWRAGETVESMKAWFKCPLIKEAIIDSTPHFYTTNRPDLVDRRGRVQRGEEIKDWLDRHPQVTNYAILDDDTDMDIVTRNFFKTCSYDGLKRDVAYKVIHHLNNKDVLDHYRMDINLTKFLSELRACYGDVESYSKVEKDLIEQMKQLSAEYKNKQRRTYG